MSRRLYESNLGQSPGNVRGLAYGFGALLVAALACVGVSVSIAQGQRPSTHAPAEPKWKWSENPFSGDAEQIAEGERLYKSTCYICHADHGGRGPDLHKSKLKGTAFLRVVMEGRKGTQMPAWRTKLSEEEAWKILAYIEAGAEETQR